MRTSSAPRSLEKDTTSLVRFSWAVLAYIGLVIAWGAFVRATGSGAGCGRHWPLCNGEVLPRSADMAMAIELSHRVTSGIAAFLFVPALFVWTLRALPKGHRARRWSFFAMICGFGEALIGAGLVLFELVAHDTSMKRGVSMVLHLDNTFLLLAALALTTYHLMRPHAATAEPESFRGKRVLRVVLGGAIGAFVLLGSSGAIAALGDTLFPATSVKAGLAQDISPMAHAFLKLRLLHPFIALAAGALVLGGANLVRTLRPHAKTAATVVTVLFLAQFGVGLLNVTLLAPVWMQMVHLLLADATWVALVLLTRHAFAPASADVPVEAASAAPVAA